MINALLVRWVRGWHEVSDPAAIAAYGRLEGSLSLGDQVSVAEVERVGRGQLAVEVREAVEVDLAPVDDSDTPYTSFIVGDTVAVPDVHGVATQERVTTLTVAEDENRQLSWVPELKDVLLDRQERQDQAIARMASGSLAGTSSVATPLAAPMPMAPIAAVSSGTAAPAAAAAWNLQAAQYVNVIDAGMWQPLMLLDAYSYPVGDGTDEYNELAYNVVALGDTAWGTHTLRDGVLTTMAGIYVFHVSCNWVDHDTGTPNHAADVGFFSWSGYRDSWGLTTGTERAHYTVAKWLDANIKVGVGINAAGTGAIDVSNVTFTGHLVAEMTDPGREGPNG